MVYVYFNGGGGANDVRKVALVCSSRQCCFVLNLTSNVLCFGVDNALIEKRSIFLGGKGQQTSGKCAFLRHLNLALVVVVDKYLTQNRLETRIPKMGLDLL